MYHILRMRRLKFIDFSLAFKDRIEYDEPHTLEDFIGNLKHCYEHSKCKNKSQQGWKGKEKGKGKWEPKRTTSNNAKEKENVAPHVEEVNPLYGQRRSLLAQIRSSKNQVTQ